LEDPHRARLRNMLTMDDVVEKVCDYLVRHGMNHPSRGISGGSVIPRSTAFHKSIACPSASSVRLLKFSPGWSTTYPGTGVSEPRASLRVCQLQRRPERATTEVVETAATCHCRSQTGVNDVRVTRGSYLDVERKFHLCHYQVCQFNRPRPEPCDFAIRDSDDTY
jgi:hypothetical protein